MKRTFLKFVNRKFTTTIGDGDFTASQHQLFLLKAEEEWTDGKFQDDYIAHADAAVQQLEKQTTRFSQLDNKMKDNSVTLTWIKNCGAETTEFVRADDSCTVTGAQADTDSETYAFDRLQKYNFSVDEEALRTDTYTEEEYVGRQFLIGDKLLSEYWAKQLLAFYSANAGANIPAIRGVVNPFTWDGVNSTTNVPAGSYNISMVATLIRQMQLNMVNNGIFINDGTLFDEWMNAGLNSGNLDGKGNDARLKQINMNFDLWNFLASGATENMFLVDRAAVAMKTYSRFDAAPKYVAGTVNQWRYSMASKILPGVTWDIRAQLICDGDGHDVKSFQMETEGGIWLNPKSCPQTIGGTDYTPTGIYGFTKTA